MSVNEILTNLDSWIEVFLSNLGIWGSIDKLFTYNS